MHDVAIDEAEPSRGEITVRDVEGADCHPACPTAGIEARLTHGVVPAGVHHSETLLDALSQDDLEAEGVEFEVVM